MNTQVMHEVSIETQQGKMTFPNLVRRLLEVGVESYVVDFAAGRKTYYLADGATHTEPMILKLDPVAREFSAHDLLVAIRGAQADTVRYPEFVKRSTAAGVIGYWAFLSGRKVTYFGRKGEQHIEEFPKAPPQK
jgi:uncharacterized protein YbcV (DUF1398 family)